MRAGKLINQPSSNSRLPVLDACRVILSLLVLSSCGYAKDVTRNPVKWQCLSREYELSAPVFLVQFPDSKAYALDPPGRTSSAPATIEDYLRHPQTWMYTEAYQEKFGNFQDNWLILPICDVIPAGTRIRVFKLTEKTNRLFGRDLSVWAQIRDNTHSHLPVNMDLLCRDYMGSNPTPKVKLEYLRPVCSPKVCE